MSSNLVPWMIISWIHDGYYGNMVDEYHIIYTYLVPCWCYTEPESRDSYHGHMIPWHHVSLRRHIMCHVSLRRQGWAVCVCVTQLAAHVSVSSTLQGHNLMSHDHIFGSESHTNVRNHESVGDLLLVYLHFWSWTHTYSPSRLSLTRWTVLFTGSSQRTTIAVTTRWGPSRMHLQKRHVEIVSTFT